MGCSQGDALGFWMMPRWGGEMHTGQSALFGEIGRRMDGRELPNSLLLLWEAGLLEAEGLGGLGDDVAAFDFGCGESPAEEGFLGDDEQALVDLVVSLAEGRHADAAFGVDVEVEDGVDEVTVFEELGVEVWLDEVYRLGDGVEFPKGVDAVVGGVGGAIPLVEVAEAGRLVDDEAGALEVDLDGADDGGGFAIDEGHGEFPEGEDFLNLGGEFELAGFEEEEVLQVAELVDVDGEGDGALHDALGAEAVGEEGVLGLGDVEFDDGAGLGVVAADLGVVLRRREKGEDGGGDDGCDGSNGGHLARTRRVQSVLRRAG